MDPTVGSDRAIAVPRASILVVDDAVANLVALEAVLEPLGHRVVRASSGEEALRRLLQEEFAVILLDVQMPGLDGFATAQIVKSRPATASVPIIFVTALSRDTSHVFKGYATGAVDYLLKPIDPDVLRSKVQVFVDLHQRQKRLDAQARALREKELELAARRSEARYRQLMDALPVRVAAARPDGAFTYANRAWVELGGPAEGGAATFLGPGAAHPDDAERAETTWREARASASPFALELRLGTRAGRWVWHEAAAIPERGEQGEVTGWILVATDVDARKRVEEVRGELLARAEEARALAEAANRTKDEFLATVSHELRTPLNAILGWVHMLRSGLLDPQRAARALETVERNAHVQAQIVDDILDVSRIVSGKMRVQVRRLRLAPIVEAAVETVRPAADARGVRVELSVHEGADTETAGDPGRLQQVVWNLVANAVKYTPSGGAVRVDLRRDGTAIEISVADTGAGISPAFLPHVFERFRQADSATTRAHGGLGLGLAIVRHLVELHGGTVSVASEGEGRGSSFTVRLPVRLVAGDGGEPAFFAPMEPVTGPHAPVRARARLEGHTVLFVDDDADARDLLAELFRDAGAHVVAADTAEAAIAQVRAHRPSVLVSDIGLPVVDGYGLIERLRLLPEEQGGRTPAVAVSGYARTEDRRRALASGFQVHLAKPVEPEELLAIVASLAVSSASP